MKIQNVAVYAASSTQIDASFFEVARQLGRGLAEHGLTLVNGAGNMGLMQASADACMEAGGKAIGVIPTFMIEQNWHHTGMTQLIEVPDMHVRKRTMAELSQGAIVLPGGVGTWEEMFEIITWKQLGLYLNPIVILNAGGYYDPMIEMIHRAADGNFMRQQHLDGFRVATTAEEAIEMLLSMPQWDKNVRRFAAI